MASPATGTRAADRELELYRNLMPVPDKFEDGFGGKTVVGALFLGFLMVPGSIYLTLFIGGGLGPAAQWVTVILFSEIAKRSMKSLRQQEIFVLFYMTGVILGGNAIIPWNTQLLWNQFYVQSPAAGAMGIAEHIPFWVAPGKEALQESGRTFLFNAQWRIPILYMIGMLLLQRIDQFGLGYALFRITAHVEKLPFPMAPAQALGVTALVETRDPAQRWKWRCFSFGAVVGLAFGLIYVGVPAITGAFLTTSVKIIPIPWLDLTPYVSTREFLPAVPLNLILDLGGLITGMVLPFWAVMGMLVGMIVTVALNPVLYSNGILKTWVPGSNYVDTTFGNYLDFYLSFSIGLMLAIFVVSLVPVIRPLMRVFAPKRGGDGERGPGFWRTLTDRSRERGDLSILTSLAIYVFSTLIYIGICMWMMPGTEANGFRDRFPWLFFLGFAFVYQPLISYTNAKLVGMVGQTVTIPLVRESAFILSGYQGATIWFAPIPLADYGPTAQSFRVMELTGTRLTSLIKTEILVFPVLIISTVLFSELIWRIAPIPSESYPFTREYWDLNAKQTALYMSSTIAGTSPFLESLRPSYVTWGGAVGLAVFSLLGFLRMPTLLTFGIVGGIGQSPGNMIPLVIGALLSKFYFERKFGQETFKKYIMIVFAGYAAGVGLIGMASVAINLIAKSTTTLGY